MPEAVIVDTIRTPIGRAFKGSLAQLRPDEMGAYVVDQLLERNPGVDPATVEDVFCGCGMPQGLQAFNIGRIVSLLSEKLPADRQRGHRLPLLLLQPRRDPPRGQRDQGRRGRRLHRRRGRVGEPLQRAHRAGRRRRPEREPAGQGRPARRLHRDGQDGGQRRREIRGQPRRHGQVRAALPGTGGEAQEDGFFDREIVPVTLPDGTEVERTTGRAPPRPWSGSSCRSGLRRRTAGHRRQLLPAQRRRRRGAADERHARADRAGPDAAGADRHLRRHGATSPSTWASRRSARSRRRSTGPG